LTVRRPAGNVGSMGEKLYEDAVMMADATGLTLRRYYFPSAGSKRIEYSDIRGVSVRPMNWLTGKGRLWGTGSPGYWLPLDVRRMGKSTLLVFDLGGRVKPCVSPDEPERLLALLSSRVHVE
jgi:hypothetical protein